MAGEAAAAAGLPILSPTTHDLREGATEINVTRDQLANHMTTGQHAIAQVSGLPAALAEKVVNLSEGVNEIALRWSGQNLVVRVDGIDFTLARQDTVDGKRNYNDGYFGNDAILTPHGRANPVGGSYVVAYIGGDGRIGASPSSRRFKQNIAAMPVDLQAVLAMELVTFRLRRDVREYGDAAPVLPGFIAEELHDLGLTWLVAYDDGGRPRTVHYDRIAMALLPVIQQQQSRLDDLEARLSKLEGSN